jgi:colanic acid biosynthesis glycosyl transferase WcaI
MRVPMRILLFSNLYLPEPTGIGPYSGGLASELVRRGHEVIVIAANPSYPFWKLFDGFNAWRWSRRSEDGVEVHRVPVYIPAKVGGAKRILHYGGYAAAAAPVALTLAFRFRPNVVIAVVPTLMVAPLALLTAKLAGAASLLHVQDFEVEAGFATGQMNGSGKAARAAFAFERRCIGAFDQTSSISPEMCAKLIEKGRDPATVHELRNWAEIDAVTPRSTQSSIYRELWNITTPHVALYSGSIAKKQGIETIVEVARALKDRRDITFILCGNGPTRVDLEASAAGLSNIQFRNLQPKEELGELLALATVHLLPQKRDAADLVLPSKLTNMLASGKPVVAGADLGCGLAREVEGCGLAVEPEDTAAMVMGIERLLDDPVLYAASAAEARRRAEQRWARDAIIDRVEAVLTGMAETRERKFP